MRTYRKLCLLFLVLFSPASLLLAADPAESADMILLHGRVYTVDAKHPWAEAIAVRQGKILAVGSNQDILRYKTAATKIVEAKGRLVLPGFTDCHVHFLDGSLSLQYVNVDEAKTVAQVQQQIKAYAVAHPNAPWILGRGWSYPVFAPSGLPDKKQLDAVVPDRPAYIEGFDGHTWWANSKAMEVAHITKDTPDPAGGAFVRDPTTGEPTGAVKEDAADAIVRKAIPELTREEKLHALRNGIKLANHFGLTRVHVLGGVNAGRDDLQNVDIYEELRRNGELTLRFYLAYRLDPPDVSEQQIKQIIAARDRYRDDWIAAGSVKFFMDGVIETHTAAMLAPYANDRSTSGQLLWQPENYRVAVTKLDANGIQIFTHAIGDRAIRVTLDAYENAAKINGTHDARHRIEHIEDPSAEDIPRFGRLGVISSMQPLHSYPDEDTLKTWAPSVGPERAQRGWPMRSIQSGGGVLAFGSDWPIVTLNPWEGIQNAITRETTDGEPKGGWIPSERISLADSIKGYTLNAAVAGHREHDEGSLEAGKSADLIVLSQDLFSIDPHAIGKTKVLLTIVGGKTAYRADNF